MYCIKLTFKPKTKINDEEKVSGLFWNYLGSLFKNGQILYEYTLCKNNEVYMAFVTVPEDDSLDERYNNVYAAQYLDELKKIFETGIEILGIDQNTDDSCNCEEKPEWYMLFTNYKSDDSPVICGRCGNTVPLYKLPFINSEEEHYSIISWYNNYKDIDNLWMSSLSDRFTYRQMNNINSQLSKDGREICASFEKATGIPFYYYVFHCSSIYVNRKTPAVCPGCGEDWKLTEDNSLIDYKCDKCRLVADDI